MLIFTNVPFTHLALEYNSRWYQEGLGHEGSKFCFCLFVCFRATPQIACGIFLRQPGTEQAPPAVEARSLNHWTVRGVATPESEVHKEKASRGKVTEPRGVGVWGRALLAPGAALLAAPATRALGEVTGGRFTQKLPRGQQGGILVVLHLFLLKNPLRNHSRLDSFSHSKWDHFYWVLWGEKYSSFKGKMTTTTIETAFVFLVFLFVFPQTVGS